MNLIDSNVSPVTQNRKEPSSPIVKVTNKILLGLGYILALIFALALGLPVILLPLSTTVPVWIWIPLSVVDIVVNTVLSGTQSMR